MLHVEKGMSGLGGVRIFVIYNSIFRPSILDNGRSGQKARLSYCGHVPMDNGMY